jgi:hypothetical protein
MKILNTPIRDLTYQDVVEFCQEKHVEGIQVDYKLAFPQKGLARQFAAFSNTRGGIIIVGVEEDPRTGLPTQWEGIDTEGKLIDRVHQFAANVEPIPDYDVCFTDERNGKAFLLIRIFEGGGTPYYEQNNSNIWVRTGNITNPVDIASPEALSLLFGKKEQANLARTTFIQRADEVFQAALRRAERERIAEIAAAEDKRRREEEQQGVASNRFSPVRLYKQELGTQSSMCTVILQPYYPHKAFIQPLALEGEADQIRVRDKYNNKFPSLDLEMIPEGILSFNWGKLDGLIECEQIYGYGLVYKARDILWVSEDEKQLFLAHVANHLMITLRAAGKYYEYVGYQGRVIGSLSINGVEDVTVNQIVPSGYNDIIFNKRKCLLDSYKWALNTETTVLENSQALREYFIQLMNEIYVGLNYIPPDEKLFDAFLEEWQLLSL